MSDKPLPPALRTLLGLESAPSDAVESKPRRGHCHGSGSISLHPCDWCGVNGDMPCDAACPRPADYVRQPYPCPADGCLVGHVCDHRDIGLPGCKTCDPRTISEGGPQPELVAAPAPAAKAERPCFACGGTHPPATIAPSEERCIATSDRFGWCVRLPDHTRDYHESTNGCRWTVGGSDPTQPLRCEDCGADPCHCCVVRPALHDPATVEAVAEMMPAWTAPPTPSPIYLCGSPSHNGNTFCMQPLDHKGQWHDDGRACWPVAAPEERLAEAQALARGVLGADPLTTVAEAHTREELRMQAEIAALQARLAAILSAYERVRNGLRQGYADAEMQEFLEALDRAREGIK